MSVLTDSCATQIVTTAYPPPPVPERKDRKEREKREKKTPQAHGLYHHKIWVLYDPFNGDLNFIGLIFTDADDLVRLDTQQSPPQIPQERTGEEKTAQARGLSSTQMDGHSGPNKRTQMYTQNRFLTFIVSIGYLIVVVALVCGCAFSTLIMSIIIIILSYYYYYYY